MIHRRVNRVREINGLVKGLLNTQHRYRLSEPSCYNDCSHSPGNGHNHPHMVDPADAAKDWLDVEAAATQLGLELVS